MRRRHALLLAFLLLPAALRAGEWRVPTAAQRHRLHPAGEEETGETGLARLYPCGLPRVGHAAVFRADGAPLGCRILWQAPGEPLTLLFDAAAAGQAPVEVYLSQKAAGDGPEWQPRSGLVLETRPLRESGEAEQADPDARFAAAGEAYGRGPAERIFLGLNPFGPAEAFACRYRGWLRVETAGAYGLATAADGPSVLRIDGRVVSRTTDWRGIHRHRRGERGGAITLAAGRHRLEYLALHRRGATRHLLAWKPPGAGHYTLLPAAAVPPLRRYATAAVETRTEETPIRFAWSLQAHSLVGEAALVTVRFTARPLREGWRYRWRFDDGATASGTSPLHDLVGGQRRVELLAVSPAGERHRVAHTVAVHPRWTQREELDPGVWQAQRRRLARRDWAATPPADLAALIPFAQALEARELLSALGRAALARPAAFAPEQLGLFRRLAFHFQHHAVRAYQQAVRAFRVVADAETAEPALRASCRLHLGGLLLHIRGEPAAARAILGTVDPEHLDTEARRLLQIYRGDARLATGEVAAAREQYLRAGTVVERSDLHYVSRRRARLEAAKDYIRRGEFTQALALLREIEWETPLDRLGTETGLLMIQAHLGRDELAYARQQCLRLLQAAPPGRQRAELLYHLVAADRRLALDEEADAALRRLLREHPYTEPAARALDEWGRPPKPPRDRPAEPTER